MTSLSGPNIAGVMSAKTARGDRLVGLSTALLAKLTRYDWVQTEAYARQKAAQDAKGLIVPVHVTTGGVR